LAAQPPALTGIPSRTVSSPSAGQAARGPQKVSWTRRPAHPTCGGVWAGFIGSSSFPTAAKNLDALEHSVANGPTSDDHDVVLARAADDGVWVGLGRGQRGANRLEVALLDISSVVDLENSQPDGRAKGFIIDSRAPMQHEGNTYAAVKSFEE